MHGLVKDLLIKRRNKMNVDLEELSKAVIWGGILALIFLIALLYFLGFDFSRFLEVKRGY